jgi:predicted Rossmann fold flavoprotein
MAMGTTLIVGAGAAGLSAAIFSKAGRTLVLEQLSQPARKLLATGGGRCNVTHSATIDELMAEFGKRDRFVEPALSQFLPEDICELLSSNGVPTIIEEDGCVFPESGKALDVIQALYSAAEKNASFIYDCEVTELLVEAEHVVGVKTASGKVFHGDKVIFCTGGKCRRFLGSTGAAYEMLSKHGIKITPLMPALAPIFLKEKWLAELSGISCPNALLSAKGVEPISGAILFTHTGISGPAALAYSGQIAARFAKAKEPYTLKLSYIADMLLQDWIDLFDSWRRPYGTSQVHTLLSKYLPKSLAKALCKQAGLEADTIVAYFNRGMTERLAELCSGTKLTISGLGDWESAMVTHGGVSIKEIDPFSMESKSIKGLYVTGELVDVDAPCGGYNITWALASGKLAAEQ